MREDASAKTWKKLVFKPTTSRMPLFFFPKLYRQRIEFGGEIDQFFIQDRWVPIVHKGCHGVWQWVPVRPVFWFVWCRSGAPILAQDSAFEPAF